MLRFTKLQEMAYPTTWSLEKFKSIRSFAGKLRYADEHLKKLASGSARTIFKIDDEKVLKVAKNNKGLAQNSVESEFYLQNYDIIARVFETDEDNEFLEMEYAKKITKKRFKELTGLTLQEVQDYLSYLHYDMNPRKRSRYYVPKEINLSEYESNFEFISSLREVCLDYDMNYPGDFGRESTYGEVMRNGEPTIVIIDFGLTNSVYDDFYRRVK